MGIRARENRLPSVEHLCGTAGDIDGENEHGHIATSASQGRKEFHVDNPVASNLGFFPAYSAHDDQFGIAFDQSQAKKQESRESQKPGRRPNVDGCRTGHDSHGIEPGKDDHI